MLRKKRRYQSGTGTGTEATGTIVCDIRRGADDALAYVAGEAGNDLVCNEVLCQAPASTAGYLTSVVSRSLVNFQASATCAPTFDGDATVSPCSGVGRAYVLEGCEASGTL